MERNSQHSNGYRLESQIREAYGRVTYTQTTHNKKVARLSRLDNNIKITQIIMSALTTSGFIVTIIWNDNVASIIGALISVVLLMLNSYMKSFNLSEIAQEHTNAADLLWKIREEYVSLLTDFEILTLEEIMAKRDDLQERTFQVNCNSPKTDKKSYSDAQKALKTEEEQTFSDEEIDLMLPNSIRRSSRTI